MCASWIDKARRLAVAVALTSGLGAPAMAADDTSENVQVYSASPDEYAVLVPSTGLDLRSPAGEAGLRHRVFLAAIKVCGEAMPKNMARDALDSDAMLGCRHDSLHAAEPQVASLVAGVRSGRSFAAAESRVLVRAQ